MNERIEVQKLKKFGERSLEDGISGKRDGVGRILEWIHNLEDGKVLE